MTANTWYNGMVTAVYQYDPYGQVEYGSTEYTDFYGYNGESYNPNTGLVYLRARYYNAEQGRFFQEDTYPGSITDPLTLNRYAYVKNSPLNYTDPSGHKIPSVWDMISSAENKRREVMGRLDDYIWDKVTGGIKEMMNTAQELCRNLDCGLGTAVYNIVPGVGFALFDNVILQTETSMAQLLNPSWDSSDSKRYRQEIEDWVIENGVTDTTYFYLGQIISDALQAYFVVKQIPRIITKLGPALARLSAVLSGADGGSQLATAGVGAYALDVGLSVETADALVGAIGLAGAGVAIVFMDVSGIGHDADKFVEALTGGTSTSQKGGVPVPEKTKASNGLDYQSNPKHTPGQPGNRPNAGIEPKNSLELFGDSVQSAKKPNQRFTYDESTSILHRFFNDGNGTWHWSGSTNQGQNSIPGSDVPNDIKNLFNLPKKGW